MQFDTLGLDPALLRGVSDLGFTEPTSIQKGAIPPALAGRDVLAAAMTGSGKTAAFVLPLLQRLSAGRGRGTRALVLTPTRELAAQVHEHLAALGRHLRVRSTTVYGGVGQRPQERALRSGVPVVVATPGRLLDLMGQGAARFEELEILVLDEADRMLDMGFLPDVRRILAALPRRRQTLLFSATLPPAIAELARTMLTDPARLDVERAPAPATGVTQELLPVPAHLKPSLLVELLLRGEVETALVFTRTKHRANRLHAHLEEAGIACGRIHGNRSQSQRQAVLAAFKAGRLQVLVATDIAARGIDVAALPHVVNFDVPGQPEDYIHRVGRTARASATGHALTFVAPDEARQIASIERAVGRKRRGAGSPISTTRPASRGASRFPYRSAWPPCAPCAPRSAPALAPTRRGGKGAPGRLAPARSRGTRGPRQDGGRTAIDVARRADVAAGEGCRVDGGAGPIDNAASPEDTTVLDRLQLSDFGPIVGRSVALHREGEAALALELVEARGLSGASRGGRQPFSLLYRGPTEPVLPQGIYRMDHPEVGALELFLVPLGPDGEARDGLLYEAVFT
ncbi:MAG: DEAD/DEAH box helicase [Thermoanaerobaculia bacterium]